MKTKKEALAALTVRRKKVPEQIDNGSLYAGSPMYFYCSVCGHESDCLPESYMTTPKHLCTPCQEMRDKGWI